MLGFLNESHRVLKKGGVLSMGIPDTEEMLNAYVNRDEEYRRLCREIWHPQWCDTWMYNVNFHFRQGKEHKYCYDFETLQKILYEVGFKKIERRSFDPELDSEARRLGTLYIRAQKGEAG